MVNSGSWISFFFFVGISFRNWLLRKRRHFFFLELLRLSLSLCKFCAACFFLGSILSLQLGGLLLALFLLLYCILSPQFFTLFSLFCLFVLFLFKGILSSKLLSCTRLISLLLEGILPLQLLSFFFPFIQLNIIDPLFNDVINIGFLLIYGSLVFHFYLF